MRNLHAVRLHMHACVRTGRERNMNIHMRVGSFSAVYRRLRNAHLNSGRCTHSHACTRAGRERTTAGRHASCVAAAAAALRRPAPSAHGPAPAAVGGLGWGGGGAASGGDWCSWHGRRVGRLLLRGGGGGGPRTRVDGGSKKGQWLGLKRSADGGHVVMEEPQRAPTAKFLKSLMRCTFTRALTFQNFGPGRGEARAARSGRGQARC